MLTDINTINNYSGVLNVIIASITAIITLIYVVFTYRQMRASQVSMKAMIKQIKVEKQPCIVFNDVKSNGSNCFYKDRRQLHINLEVENIGDAPAMSIYCFSYLKLQNNEEIPIVNMDYLPDYVQFLKVGDTKKVSTRYETDEINLLLEDLTITSAKNIHRINSDPTKAPFSGTVLVFEVFYRNLVGQWFVNERHTQILDILERKENGDIIPVNPANTLKDDVWFELQFIAEAFSANDIRLVEKKELIDKLKPYENDRVLLSKTEQI